MIYVYIIEAKEEYIARYLDGNIGKHTWPPTESYKPNLTDQTKSDHGPLSPDLTSRLPPLDITPEEAAQLGYMPQRDDFERVCFKLLIFHVICTMLQHQNFPYRITTMMQSHLFLHYF